MMVGSTNRQVEKSTFVYDGAGRRVKTAYEKNMFFGNKKTQQMNYLLDVTKPYDNVLMIEGSETTGRTADNKPLCNWSYQEFIEQKFTYGLEMLSVDKTEKNSFLRKNKFIDRDYYLQDELGSPIKIVDQSGRVEKTYKYDEFGRPIQPRFGMNCDRTDNVFSYTGYQYDAGTGLMYAQARYYMPSAGRFVSKDIVKGTVVEPQSFNRYVYCVGNPLRFVDPSGHWGELVHVNATIWIFAELGLNSYHANIVATANIGVDSGITAATNKNVNAQGWHFDRNQDDNVDSRQVHADEMLNGAKFNWNWANEAYKNGEITCEERHEWRVGALQMIGRGLHALQDIDAHMNIGTNDFASPISEPHAFSGENHWRNYDNIDNPQYDAEPTRTLGEYRRIDTKERLGSQRYRDTVARSKEYLNSFYSQVNINE